MLQNNKDLALLTARMQIPMVIDDIMKGQSEYTDQVHYSLHDAFSDMLPDTALLTIALSAQKLLGARADSPDTPTIDILKMECERIVEEYGAVCGQNVATGTVDEDKIYDTLIHTAEDLEDLAELLNSACTHLREDRTNAASLCDVLHVQASAHSLIAEAFMEAADQHAQERTTPIEVEITSEGGITEAQTNNVIAFPGPR